MINVMGTNALQVRSMSWQTMETITIVWTVMYNNEQLIAVWRYTWWPALNEHPWGTLWCLLTTGCPFQTGSNIARNSSFKSLPFLNLHHWSTVKRVRAEILEVRNSWSVFLLQFSTRKLLYFGVRFRLTGVSAECRFILRRIREDNLETQAGVHLIEGVRFIQGLLNTSFTVLAREYETTITLIEKI